ncbi:anthranilate synthase component I [bacterium]|nr:anthranilate synthase component I [bacterium]
MTRAAPRLVVRRRIDDTETPVSALLKLGVRQPGVFLFESVTGAEHRSRYSFVGLAPDLWWRVSEGRAETARDHEFTSVEATSDDPVSSLREFVDVCRADGPADLPPMAAGAFGYIGFEMARYVENLPVSAPDPDDLPEALLMRPGVVLIFDAVKQEIILAAPERGGPGSADALLDATEQALDAATPGLRPAPARDEHAQISSNTTRDRYFEMVERARTYIRAGDIFQVVPSQRFSIPFERPAFAFYRALRRLNPSPFMFYINFGGFQVSGASPEILVRLRDGLMTVRPIAGTLPRGATPEEDAANERRLLADEKERAEHLMLLDLGRNDVGRVAIPGTVRVVEAFGVERYSHVMHIVSTVEGRVRPGVDMVSALMAGFPAGTVSGAPKIRAMEIISELEPHARGVYAGGVGYFGSRGDMDTCIALRTAVFKDGRMIVQAGGGVVFDSDQQSEYDETRHKAAALFRAAEQAATYDRGIRDAE